ncbi:MAG TPA: hypothetical protein PK621_10050, partial [Syntrophales bacterium]|nr:hypothetical protein [Syntrophales bacterium]
DPEAEGCRSVLTGMSRDELLGMGGLLGGVGLFSAVEVASKIIGPRVDPVVLTFLRFFLTGIVLILLSLPLLRLRIVPLGGGISGSSSSMVLSASPWGSPCFMSRS